MWLTSACGGTHGDPSATADAGDASKAVGANAVVAVDGGSSRND